MSGFMGQILRVDLSTGTIKVEPLPEKEARLFLGGSGLATWYLLKEVPPGIDPLGPENKLIYMTGPLTGTLSPSSGRFSAVAKSPLTGLWGSANSGGRFGLDLKKSGFDGVILEGVSPKPVALVINDGRAELVKADSLWGLGVTETTRRLKKGIWPQAECLLHRVGRGKPGPLRGYHERYPPGPGPLRVGCGHGVQEA